MEPFIEKYFLKTKYSNEILYLGYSLITILTLIFLIKFKFITNYNLSIINFGSGIIAIFTIIYWMKRERRGEKQLKQINKQIKNQEKTRKDQQFLDAIKLIEETNDINSKIAYLKILENLANEDIDYRQKILDYLGVHTEKLREIVDNLKFEDEFNWQGSRKESYIGFKKYLLEGTFGKFQELNVKFDNKEIDRKFENNEIKLEYEEKIEYLEDEYEEGLQIENSYFNIKIKSKIKNNQAQLKQNFFELMNEEKKFEFECLKLCYKLINMHSKIKKELTISNIFIPFLTIEHLETNLTLYSNYPENTFGLTYIPLEKKETKIQPNYISNYANIQNIQNLYFEREFGEGTSLINVKNIFNLSHKIKRIYFNKIKLSLNNFIQFDRNYEFNKCSFYQTNFIIKNENELKEVKKNEWYSKVNFINSYFGPDCKFKNFIFKELYFNNCEVSKEYPIQGLETVQILSKDKEKLNEMIKGFKDLISKNKKIGIPQFPNARWAEEELKKYKGKLMKNGRKN